MDDVEARVSGVGGRVPLERCTGGDICPVRQRDGVGESVIGCGLFEAVASLCLESALDGNLGRRPGSVSDVARQNEAVHTSAYSVDGEKEIAEQAE